MEQLLYMEIDSHFWTDLEQLKLGISYDILWQNKRENIPDNPLIDLYQPLTKKYIIIGLENSLKYGYNIRKSNPKFTVRGGDSFFNIEGMINYLYIKDTTLSDLLRNINNTLDYGYNITSMNINNKNNVKMERKDVYKSIDTERKYQDLRWSTRRTAKGTPDEEKPPAEWINYIEYHVSAAKNEVYHLNTEEALAHVRKVAALAVRCLELYGCPERIIPSDLETNNNNNETNY